MKTVQELIEETISERYPKASTEEKKEKMALLEKSLVSGESLTAAELGVTPELINNHYAFAYRLYTTGNFKAASALFSWLCLLEEQNPLFHFSLASCYHMLKDYKRAKNMYLNAFLLDVNNPLPFFHLADCFTKLKDIPAAIQSLDWVIKTTENDPKYSHVRERSILMREHLVQENSKSKPQAAATAEGVKK